MKQNPSLTLSKNRQPKRSQSRAWLIALIMLAVVAVGLYQLWLVWPTLVVETVHWQREASGQLADILYEAKDNAWTAGTYLAGFSFLYGMLHSLGPGHGKVIVSTYLATHPTKVRASLVITVVSALFQAIVAIALVTVLVWGFSASMRMVNEKAMQFVSASFALVALLGGLICYKSIKAILRSLRADKIPSMKISSFSPVGKGAPIGFQVMSSHTHHSDTACGCGHNHVAEADAINHASTWREYMAIIASIGIRPCTGAIMVLLFANVVGLYWMGVVSAILMAVGTALTTSIIAIMTLTSKHLVKRYLASGKQLGQGWRMTGAYVQLFGGILLVALGLLLLSGENYGLSPMFSV